MINGRVGLLSVLMGLNVGFPLSNRLLANADSVFNPVQYNVVYDLKCLYGDVDGNHILSKEEYEAFDVNSLLENSANQSACFLGFNPIDADNMIFYFYSVHHFDEYSNYQLYYQNSSHAIDSDNFENDYVKESKCTLLNSYCSGSGYFYKFKINNYVPDVYDGNMRIKGVSFNVLSDEMYSYKISDFDSSELFYNDYGVSSISKYFSDKVYELNGVVDMYLACTSQISSPLGHTFFIPYGQKSYVESAKEIPVFFFNFNEKDFSIDEIKSVTWQCYIRTFQQIHYYTSQMSLDDGHVGEPYTAWKGVYEGKYDDEKSKVYYWIHNQKHGLGQDESKNDSSQKYWVDEVNQIGEDDFVKKTTYSDITKITQNDTWDGWFKDDFTPRSYDLPNIINMTQINSVIDSNIETWKSQSNDDYKGSIQGAEKMKEFFNADDHLKYKWAYTLQDDNWNRTIQSKSIVVENDVYDFSGLSSQSSALYQTTSLCHQPVNNSIVTLSMKVTKDNKNFDLKVMHEPKSVRNVYMVKIDAPTFSDFLADDLSSFWKNNKSWLIALFVVLAFVVFAALLSFSKPLFNGAKFICKALFYFVEVVVNLLYLILLWWWIALIQKCCGRSCPKAWFVRGFN